MNQALFKQKFKTEFAVSYIQRDCHSILLRRSNSAKYPEKLAELHASCNFLRRPFLTTTRRATRYKISVHLPFIRYAACTRRGIFNDFAQENCSYRHLEYIFLSMPYEVSAMLFTILLNLDVRLRFADIIYTRKFLISPLFPYPILRISMSLLTTILIYEFSDLQPVWLKIKKR